MTQNILSIVLIFQQLIVGIGKLILENKQYMGFPCGSAGKESTCNSGDLGSTPALKEWVAKNKQHIDINFMTFILSYCSSVDKESACSAGDLGSIPGLGRSPGEGTGNPLQYPCLENLMDRGAWWAAVYDVAKSQARLSD